MESWEVNPYEEGTDHYEIWEVLIRGDFDGFIAQSWDMVADGYISEGFFGVDMGKSTDPQSWKLTFPTLESYKVQWMQDSEGFAKNDFASNPREVFYKTTRLENFDFHDDTVLVHKVFDGTLTLTNGQIIPLKWRSLFLLKHVGSWKIAGFCGYIHE
ncbi:hypothetical protein ACFQZI_03265 [Mucilaginibacter lutimaris]|uniref:DUF4440 domain-containing protein n=1 Tax=Mucilaginibacter lutimaris TaxID=931629 RepID=A0ABW2ZAL3_9SPHI